MFDTSWGAPERISRLAQRVSERHDDLAVRPANMKRFRAELETLKRIYSEEAWGETWGFVSYTNAEFNRLASELRLIADPDIVLLAELSGQTAGVVVGLPDANQLFKRGRLFPLGVFLFLNRRRIIDQMHVPILGLMPEYRNRGLDMVLMHEIYERGMAKGYKRAELSWVLEDNQAINHAFEVGGAKLYKTYRIYQKEIG
jgi:GNAT superfamily N-acetyltransferase